jgi:hypothetical protein
MAKEFTLMRSVLPDPEREAVRAYWQALFGTEYVNAMLGYKPSFPNMIKYVLDKIMVIKKGT